MSKYDNNDELIIENIKTLENKIINSLPKEEELSHNFSRKFQKKMNKLIKKEKRSPFIESFISYGKRAGVVLFIVISVAFATTMSVEAYRVRFFEVITRVWEEFTSITFKSEKEIIDRKLIAINPDYIPEGFSILEEDVNDYVNTVIYENESNEEIIYEQSLISNGEIIFDTEDVEVETMNIENQTINFFTNKGVSQIYWNDDLYIYTLNSAIDIEETLKMAKSILE